MNQHERLYTRLQKDFPTVKPAPRWLAYSADFYLKAKNLDEVSELYRLAPQMGFAILPLGSGSLLPPKSAPVTLGIGLPRQRGSLVLNAERLTLEVGSSATVRQVNERLAKAGLVLRHLPDNPGSTLGGWLGSSARGMERLDRGGKEWPLIGGEYLLYGGLRGFVGRRTLKGVAGYELSRLLQGKWGRLGWAESLILRLRPKAERERLVLVCPSEPAGWAELFGELPFRLKTLVGLELVDKTSAPFVGWPVAGPRFAALSWLAGPSGAVEKEVSELVSAVCGGGSLEIGEDDSWRRELGAFRSGISSRGEMKQILRLTANPGVAPQLLSWAERQELGQAVLVGHIIDGEYELYLRSGNLPELPGGVEIRQRIYITDGVWRLADAPAIEPLVGGFFTDSVV
jgi:FAD/FMN-containing dehydrogenase